MSTTKTNTQRTVMTFVIRGDREELNALRTQLRHIAIDEHSSLGDLYLKALTELVTQYNHQPQGKRD